MKHIKEIIESIKWKEEVALTPGMKFLEENMGPLYPGELSLICGDGDSGKSALMIQQIHRLGIDEKVPVLVVLSGKDENAFLACMAAYYCNIVIEDVHRVFADPLCKKMIEKYMELVQQSPIFFISRQEFCAQEKKLSEYVIGNGIKAIFIENILWMCMELSEQRRLAIWLKELAVKLQVAIIGEYHIWTDEDYPALSMHQLEKDDIAVFADNIIGMVDFQQRDILTDEKGNDLRGKVRIKILKHKGLLAKGKELTFEKIHLFVQDIHKIGYMGADRRDLFAGNGALNRLTNEFDCKLQDVFNID